MGKTITVEPRTGNLIIATLTILASIGTSQLWNLLTILYYHYRAKTLLADGLFWQQQVLLRTIPTPATMMMDTTKLWWTWKKKVDRPHLRSSIILSFAICFSILALVAGIFTSYVVTTSNLEVLVDSPSCGFVNSSSLLSDSKSYSISMTSSKSFVQSYARDCYKNSSFLPSPCFSTFFRPNISFTANPAPCPWEATMCSPETPSVISMDSNFVDMTHFGINTSQGEKVKFRKKTTCSILPQTGHTIVRNATYWGDRLQGSRVPLPQEEAIGYRYGNLNANISHTEDTIIHSFTSGNLTKEHSIM